MERGCDLNQSLQESVLRALRSDPDRSGSYIEPDPRGIGGTSSSQIDYAELNDFRRTLLVVEVRNRAQRVVEAVGEISGADHQRELNNLTFVVILAQLFERTGADRGSTACDPLGVKNRGLLFFVEE